jgi:hypothetical protein
MYCSISDVQSLIKWTTFTTTSKVNTNDVADFILEADALINGRIALIYNTPITNVDDVEILKFISTRLAAYEVAKVLVMQTAGKMPEIAYSWKNSADKRIMQIISRDLILPNSTEKDSTNGLYSFTSHGNSDNDYEDTEPVWKLETEQW